MDEMKHGGPQPGYPAPDRSNVTLNHSKETGDVLDLGWAEGILNDGRPYRAECWAQDQLTMLTFFFSIQGIEDASQGQLKDILVQNGLIAFEGEQQYVEGGKCLDAQGQQMWSVNVVVGADDELFVRDSLRLTRHAGGVHD